jgi:hypothetical protein
MPTACCQVRHCGVEAATTAEVHLLLEHKASKDNIGHKLHAADGRQQRLRGVACVQHHGWQQRVRIGWQRGDWGQLLLLPLCLCCCSPKDTKLATLPSEKSVTPTCHSLILLVQRVGAGHN